MINKTNKIADVSKTVMMLDISVFVLIKNKPTTMIILKKKE